MLRLENGVGGIITIPIMSQDTAFTFQPAKKRRARIRGDNMKIDGGQFDLNSKFNGTGKNIPVISPSAKACYLCTDLPCIAACQRRDD